MVGAPGYLPKLNGKIKHLVFIILLQKCQDTRQSLNKDWAILVNTVE